MTALLRGRPALVFVLFAANAPLYLWLLAHGARPAGVFISSLMAAGTLVFLFACIRGGYVLSRGVRYTIEDQPRQFWASMLFVGFLYILFTLAAVVLYLQDIGYLTHV